MSERSATYPTVGFIIWQPKTAEPASNTLFRYRNRAENEATRLTKHIKFYQEHPLEVKKVTIFEG